ncbi:MAG: hypothetical protein MZV70_67890 [Desulfobacterales bacterium]|nr:hypothetical protein [Desulfobacterales bacterium]
MFDLAGLSGAQQRAHRPRPAGVSCDPSTGARPAGRSHALFPDGRRQAPAAQPLPGRRRGRRRQARRCA